MSFLPFKEVQVANPGSSTRYGSDDLLDFCRIFNGKETANRRPEILNQFRFLTYIQLKRPAAAVPIPTEADVIHLYNDSDNKVKVKKLGGTVVDLEALGTGTWNNTSVETISNKTMNVDENTFKHSISNFVGDILVHDGTRYNRFGKGAALQVLGVNAAGTALEWLTQSGGGGGTGEANTASNIGTAGIGWFHQKLGIDLQFKKIFSPTGSITITDNVANERIDLELGASVVKTTQANIWGDFNQEFRSNRLVIKTPLNDFGYFIVGSALPVSRSLILPLLTADDTAAVLALAQTFLNKTFTTGNIFQVDTSTIKHSINNINGEILVNNGTKFAPFPRGSASQHLRINASGSGLEWFTPAEGGGGGLRLPADNSPVPSTGRFGIFWGGGAQGIALLSFIQKYARIWGSTNSSIEAVTELYTAAVSGDIAEFKTPPTFRRDMNCIFKLKWAAKQTSAAKVKIGLSSAETLPAGGGGGLGTPAIRYDVVQNSTGHLEFDGGISRMGIRFNSGAPGLNEVVTEVVVRFRKYGSPSGSATVGVRKASDGTLVTLGSFTPNSFGSGEQTVTITPSSPTYQMVLNDRVVVEFPSNTTNGMELDENDFASPSGFTSQAWDGSSWLASATIAMRFSTAPVLSGGGSGDQPLNSAHGIMIHGTFGTHTNYQIARNNGATTQTVQDSAKALANTSTHTAEININTTNIIIIIDGTSFTYTTTIPGSSTQMAFFFHIESDAAAQKGLGFIYGQVTTA